MHSREQISDNGKPFMDNGNPTAFQRVNLR